jgi:hypothetical protein
MPFAMPQLRLMMLLAVMLMHRLMCFCRARKL